MARSTSTFSNSSGDIPDIDFTSNSPATDFSAALQTSKSGDTVNDPGAQFFNHGDLFAGPLTPTSFTVWAHVYSFGQADNFDFVEVNNSVLLEFEIINPLATSVSVVLSDFAFFTFAYADVDIVPPAETAMAFTSFEFDLGTSLATGSNPRLAETTDPDSAGGLSSAGDRVLSLDPFETVPMSISVSANGLATSLVEDVGPGPGSQVPEPGTALLLGMGLLGLASRRKS